MSLFLEDGSTGTAAIGMNERQGLTCDDPTDVPTDAPGYIVLGLLGQSIQIPSDSTLADFSVDVNEMVRDAGLTPPDAESADPVVTVSSANGQVCGTDGNGDEVGRALCQKSCMLQSI